MAGAEKIRLGIVGVGGWGKNLVRNYHLSPNVDLCWLCDLDEQKLAGVQRQFQARNTTTSFDDLLQDPELQAIVVATTAPSHYPLCKAALLAGKDVYVEKPFTLSISHAKELIELAEQEGRILMVGHLLEYHPVVDRLREMIAAGDLGDIRYVYSQRLNLGTVRGDENAMWNFAPHDISVILYLLGKEPTDVSARGQCYLQIGIHDVVFLSINFGGKAMGHVHVSWLDPHKTRKLTIVGSKRMAVFDDLEPAEKLKIYDKGAELNVNYDRFAEYIGLRFGDITIPHIRAVEPLQVECEHFIKCVRERQQPRSDGRDGLRVVEVLAAADHSLKLNGEPIHLSTFKGKAQ
jgi:predicted dehydrogenase